MTLQAFEDWGQIAQTPQYERGKEPTRFAGPPSQTGSAELMEGSEHCSGCGVKGRQEMRKWLPNPPKVLDNSTNISNTAFAP